MCIRTIEVEVHAHALAGVAHEDPVDLVLAPEARPARRRITRLTAELVAIKSMPRHMS
jgi:hypothetical protein